MEPPSHVVPPSFHPGQVGTYGTYVREGASEMGHSTRFGRDDTQNVTRRDNKRPKERSRDAAYKTRFSMSSNAGLDRSPAPSPPLGGTTWPREEGFIPTRPLVSVGFGDAQSPAPSARARQADRSHESQVVPFEILLIYEGTTVAHRVWGTMLIDQLMAEAGAIFGLDPNAIVLLLFSLTPVTLRRGTLISGPPQVLPGSKVMVFWVPGFAPEQNHPFAGYGQGYHHQPPEIPSSHVFSSKLLSTFKLPKFGGLRKHGRHGRSPFSDF